MNAIRLLTAETEGIFTEPAGGTTLAAAIALVERGFIPRRRSSIVCDGNGYKTAEWWPIGWRRAVRLSQANVQEVRGRGTRGGTGRTASRLEASKVLPSAFGEGPRSETVVSSNGDQRPAASQHHFDG